MRTALLAPVLLLSLGACTSKSATPSQSATADGAAATAIPAAPNLVTVHAKDFAFTAPDRIPAGMTTFQLVNDGPGFHHAAIVRLDDGKSPKDLADALKSPGPPPNWLVFVGGPNAPDPGKQASVTLPMPAGNYAILCFVDLPGHVPHFAKGMVHPFTVVAGGASAAAPTADDTLTLTDYSFTPAHPITSGHHMIEVQNTARQPHEVEIIKLNAGVSPQQMLSWLDKPNGPPPGSGMGGVAPMGNSPAYLNIDFTPGQYLFVCFQPDAKDGKPHVMHGMMQTLTIT